MENSFRAITAAAATTTQQSETLSNPDGRNAALYVRVNVTAGATLDLRPGIAGVLEDGTEVVLVQASASITGVGVTTYSISLGNLTAPTGLININAPIPREFKLRVTHNNANAATYTVDVWRS